MNIFILYNFIQTTGLGANGYCRGYYRLPSARERTRFPFNVSCITTAYCCRSLNSSKWRWGTHCQLKFSNGFIQRPITTVWGQGKQQQQARQWRPLKRPFRLFDGHLFVSLFSAQNTVFFNRTWALTVTLLQEVSRSCLLQKKVHKLSWIYHSRM